MNILHRRNPATGAECPDWCTSGHRDGLCRAIVGSIRNNEIWASVLRDTQDDYHVSVTALVDGAANMIMGHTDARALARLIIVLSDTTPEDHRELAAALIKAAERAETGASINPTATRHAAQRRHVAYAGSNNSTSGKGH